MTLPTATPHQETIIKAALPLFAEKGYAATSMQTIAKAARMSKANLFHHFGSKETLYLAVLKQACQQSTGILNEAIAGKRQLSFQDLAPFLHNHLQTILSQPDTTLLVLREVMEGQAHIERSLANDIFAENFALLVNMIKDGMEQGLLKSETPAELVAFTLISMNLQYFQAHNVLRHLTPAPFAQDPTVFNQQLFELILQGIQK